MTRPPSRELAALKALVAQYPRQSAAAQALGIGSSYLCDLLYGRRKFSDAMLAKLGLKRVVVTKETK